ncbi:MAG: MerR family transcriptional regulator [Acidobacteriota bacterium]|jgi:DNA-binding transcriptional MerR regulator|nr:MerR family transcriptional regulator [Acidobacteriota bacterium]
MAEIKIPDKLTFKRKEVIQLAKLDGRVLDYWEKEFAAFAPMVNQSGEKFYSRLDVEVILAVKKWLIQEKRDKGLIKDLLRQHFTNVANGTSTQGTDPVDPGKLQKIRSTLREILTLLAKDDKN